jgi:putative ABC transport system permease protein
MVKSLWQLVHVDPGFRAESAISARITPNQAFCDDFSRCQAFYRTLVERVRALPGIREAALVNALPLNGRVAFIAADFEDREKFGQGAPLLFDSVITPEYTSLMQIPLIQGRGFTDSDTAANAEPVVVITASTARKFWPGQDPIGKHLKPAWVKEWRRVVGVVPDVHEASLASNLPDWIAGAIYEPYSAHAVLINRKPATEMTVVVRGATDALSFAGALREIVANLNSEVPITEVQTLRGVVSKSVSEPRSIMSLFAIFAALAVVLGAVGVYGVLSYSVAQRTSEIGVRMALGAQRSDIQRLILGQGARIAAARGPGCRRRFTSDSTDDEHALRRYGDRSGDVCGGGDSASAHRTRRVLHPGTARSPTGSTGSAEIRMKTKAPIA